MTSSSSSPVSELKSITLWHNSGGSWQSIAAVAGLQHLEKLTLAGAGSITPAWPRRAKLKGLPEFRLWHCASMTPVSRS